MLRVAADLPDAAVGLAPGGDRLVDLAGARVLRRSPRDIEVVVNGNGADVLERLKARSPEALTMESLTLEEIFIATLQPQGIVA